MDTAELAAAVAAQNAEGTGMIENLIQLASITLGKEKVYKFYLIQVKFLNVFNK